MADDVEVATWPHEPGALTGSCALAQCGWCYGYIKPVENGIERPCQHQCHENGRGNPRDYERAVRWVLRNG